MSKRGEEVRNTRWKESKRSTRLERVKYRGWGEVEDREWKGKWRAVYREWRG